MKRIVLLSLVVVMMATLLPFSTAAATTYGTVTGGWLRLRTSASFSATIVKSYYTGTVVEILGTSGSWYHVEAPDGHAGYMYSSYINLGGSGTSTGYTAYVTSANGYGVRMRTGPSKGYRVLAVYSVGTSVTVLSTGILWSRIQVGSTVGYMMSEFLTTSSPGTTTTTPEGDDMATVWSSNGYGVRLRSGPGTGYSIIGLYSVGTRVDVVTRGTTWDYIQVGSRLGYMMNEFLHYDSTTTTVASSITVTADSSTGMQGETVDLDVTVTGSNLSSPAYTLAVTGNDSMAEIVSGQLHILDTATVGAVITVTATSVDDNSSGDQITDTCTVTVTAAQPRVTAFSFDDSAITVSTASGDVQRRIGYTVSGYNLSSPYFSLALSSEAGSNVTASIDESNEEIVINISSAIADGTVFTVTGTTTADDSGGNPKTATLTVTITDETLTLTSIELLPEATALRSGDTTNINARLHYSDGSSTTAAITTDYTLEITTGASYASLGLQLLVPNPGSLEGVADQTLVITGTAVEDTSITDTCEVLLYGRNEPDPPTLTSAVPAHASVALTWAAPANDGGEDLTGYSLYYDFSESATPTLLTGAISPSATSYTVPGLTDGLHYYFCLVATNGQGDSDYSSYIDATPNPTQPSAPQNLAVSDRGNEYVDLSWDEPSDTGGTGVPIDHYVVYTDGSGGTDVSGTTIHIDGLTNGESHEFTVIAVNSATSGLPAMITSNAVGTPDAPTIGTNVAGYQRIDITWAAGADNGGNPIQSYDVYIKVSSADDSAATSYTGITATEYGFTGLSNQTYEMWVVANNGYADSDGSTRVTSTPYVAPDAPTDVEATGDSTTVTVTWAAPLVTGGQAITNYTVSYTGTASDSVVVGNVLTCDFSGLGSGSYTFYVSASNDGVHYSATGESLALSIP